jgi:ankyrin repeat protein
MKRVNTLGVVLLSTVVLFLFRCVFPAMRESVQRANNAQAAPFLHAAATGDLVRVRALLDAKADVNAKDADGITALMWASMKGQPNVVRVLLDAGADVNAHAGGGLTGFTDAFNTALMFAAENDHPDVARVLLNAGADVNAKGQMDDTALMLAALAGRSDAAQHVVQLLKAAGAR